MSKPEKSQFAEAFKELTELWRRVEVPKPPSRPARSLRLVWVNPAKQSSGKGGVA